MSFERNRRNTEQNDAAQSEEVRRKLVKIRNAINGPYFADEILRWFGSSFGSLELNNNLSSLRALAVDGFKGEAKRWKEYASAPPNSRVSPEEALEKATALERRAQELSSVELEGGEFLEFLRESLPLLK